MSLVKKHWGPISTETRQLTGCAGYEVIKQNHPSTHSKHPMTVEEGWQNLCRRCPDLSESTEKPKSFQRFLCTGAAVACLVIGLLTWFVFSNYSKLKSRPLQSSSFAQATSATKPSVNVELVRPSGNIAIEAGQAIVAGNELKTLLINCKHKMFMKVGTSLSIESLMANSQLGCLVRLEKGEIYAHVEHDGNPFVVETFAGKAVITGTTFNIKADSQQMELIVKEGTVKFENKNGGVTVKAGQKSVLTANTKPTLPALYDANTLNVWATGYKPNVASTQVKSNADDWYLALSLRKDPIILAETDYHQWVEEKRRWFKQNFPWIFELKDALAREGIEVDYPELLIKSGDVWQFACLQKFPARFSVPYFESLLKTAASYGFDREWLLKNVPSAKNVQEKSLLLPNSTGFAAFDQWLKYAMKKEDAPSPYYSADACIYLTETRSLLWFATMDNQCYLIGQNRTMILDMLQEEITVAYNCWNYLLNPFDKPQEPLCDENTYKSQDAKLIEYVGTIKAFEERIAEYSQLTGSILKIGK